MNVHCHGDNGDGYDGDDGDEGEDSFFIIWPETKKKMRWTSFVSHTAIEHFCSKCDIIIIQSTSHHRHSNLNKNKH